MHAIGRAVGRTSTVLWICKNDKRRAYLQHLDCFRERGNSSSSGRKVDPPQPLRAAPLSNANWYKTPQTHNDFYTNQWVTDTKCVLRGINDVKVFTIFPGTFPPFVSIFWLNRRKFKWSQAVDRATVWWMQRDASLLTGYTAQLPLNYLSGKSSQLSLSGSTSDSSHIPGRPRISTSDSNL